MAKTVPSFLYPTNFRNTKNIKRLIKDFSIQGFGVAIYLIETLAETENHQYPLEDIDLLADEMRLSVPVVTTIIKGYGLFHVIENNGVKFISTQLNEWLEPYYKKISIATKAGKASAAIKQKKKQEQITELSQINSGQHSLNSCSTINKLINKRTNVLDEKEKYEQLNESLLNAQLKKDAKKRREEDLNAQNIEEVEI